MIHYERLFIPELLHRSSAAGHHVADGGEEEAHHGGAAELHLEVHVLRGGERVAVGEALVRVRDADPRRVASAPSGPAGCSQRRGALEAARGCARAGGDACGARLREGGRADARDGSDADERRGHLRRRRRWGDVGRAATCARAVRVCVAFSPQLWLSTGAGEIEASGIGHVIVLAKLAPE